MGQHRETDAIESLDVALETYDAAIDIAGDHDFETRSALRSERDEVRVRLRVVQSGPIERAGSTVDRARETAGDEAVQAWL